MLRPTDTPRTHNYVAGQSEECACAKPMTRNIPDSGAAPYSFQLISQNLLYFHRW